MAPRMRPVPGRIVLAATLLAGAASVAGCGSILGLDDGIAETDGSVDGAADVTGGDDATMGTEASADDSAATDGADAGSAPDGTDADATHVGDGPEDQGSEAGCGTCPTGWFCDASTNQCDCTSDPSFCQGRCGQLNDNCGRPVSCGPCEGGCQPNYGVCGTTCGTMADAGCGMTIPCDCNGGTSGTCAGGQCCSSNVVCGASCCAVGQTCSFDGGCCTVTGCGTNGYDNCGQPDPACYDAGAVLDGGADGGGACIPSGSPCNGGPSSCCSLMGTPCAGYEGGSMCCCM